MKRLMKESDEVAIFVIASMSFALLAYEHLIVGFVDYGLLILCFFVLYIVYALSFLLALTLSI